LIFSYIFSLQVRSGVSDQIASKQENIKRWSNSQVQKCNLYKQNTELTEQDSEYDVFQWGRVTKELLFRSLHLTSVLLAFEPMNEGSVEWLGSLTEMVKSQC